jgi:hypothetical protein
MNYKIAIPSYKRPEIIKQKTLSLLKKYNIDNNKITIFVADEDEEKIYRQSLKNEYKIIVGVHTIGEQRNFIEKYYKEGNRVMMFDDDLDGVYIKKENKLELIKDLEKDFIVKGFEECVKNKANLFGLYAAANAYFMKYRIYKKLCYIPGGVFGVIINHDSFLNRVTNHGEDYEYSIRQYIKNRILIRFDYITIKSKFFKEKGGLQTIRTKKYIFNSIHKIYNMFPEFCTMYIRKSSGNAELRLKDKRK